MAASDGHAAGSPAYRRLTLAMLFAGFSTFSLLYAVQPLLPLFAAEYRLSAEARVARGVAGDRAARDRHPVRGLSCPTGSGGAR